MNLLGVLIWRAFKVRLRSHWLSLLDVAGPLLMMLTYLALKLLIGFTNSPEAGDFDNSNRLFRGTKQPDIMQYKLSRFACPKILYAGPPLPVSLDDACGLETRPVSSREQLVQLLADSLHRRVSLVDPQRDFRRTNSSQLSCETTQSGEINYQFGIVANANNNDNDNHQRSFDLYSTESISSTILYQPYNQGSSYNEYTFPQSDLNTGLYLIHSCLLGIVSGQSGPLPVQVAAYPLITDYILLPILFLLLFMTGTLLSCIATIMRVAEQRESGFHQYARSCGVSGYAYWISEIIVMLLHHSLQTLVIAMLLSIGTANHLMDPIHSAPITIRWLLLLSISLAMNLNANLIGLFFDKTSLALLAQVLLTLPLSVYFCFSHQYNAYGFSYFSPFTNYILWLPNPLFEVLVILATAIQLETGEPLTWSNLARGALGGGQSGRTFGDLWIQLILQIPITILLILIIDELRYAPNWTPLGIINSLGRNLCSLCLGPGRALDDKSITQTNSDLVIKRASQTVDPNRICCSLRELNVNGPWGFMAQTEGDCLKGAAEQLRIHQHQSAAAKSPFQLAQHHSHQQTSLASKHSGSGPGARKSASGSVLSESPPMSHHSSLSRLESNVLDESIRQHLSWTKGRIWLENLNLDFRYNQISYIVGPTNIKELFFASLMGLYPISSGSIIIEGQRYNANNIALARPYFGHLSERDVYLADLTISENLELFGNLRNPQSGQHSSEPQFLLNLLHLTKRRNRYPAYLTYRSLRKLALGVASVGNSKILLLVEPTLNLRWKPRSQVLNLLNKYRSVRSIIIDTCDIDEAASYGDRIILFRRGLADLDGSPQLIVKQLQCGFRIQFEPAKGNAGKMKDLNKLTSDLFHDDKWGPLVAMAPQDNATLASNPKKSNQKGVASQALVLNVKYSSNSHRNLMKLTNMFASGTSQAGYKLVSIDFESLEDSLVKRMSKATYPDLPADLLVSLSSRQQAALVQDTDQDSAASFRRLVGDFQVPYTRESVYESSPRHILWDRLTAGSDWLVYAIAITLSLALLAASLYLSKFPLDSYYSRVSENYHPLVVKSKDQLTGVPKLDSRLLDEFYGKRIGLFLMDDDAGGRTRRRRRRQSSNSYQYQAGTSGSKQQLPAGWQGNPRFAGYFRDRNDSRQTDEHFVADVVQYNMDMPASIIFFSPSTGRASIVFEPYSPHALTYSLRRVAEYLAATKTRTRATNTNRTEVRNSTLLATSSTKRPRREATKRQTADDQLGSTRISITRHSFGHPWTEMIRGLIVRRFFYGVGMTFAEAASMGMFLVAAHRHRSQSISVTFNCRYWLLMGLFDMLLATIQIAGYTCVICIMESIRDYQTIGEILLVLWIFKLAFLPFVYLISIVSQSSARGWAFVGVFLWFSGWIFGVNLRTFFEWTFIGGGRLYKIFDWMLIFNPIASLADSLSLIVQLNRMNQLCKLVPVYVPTSPLVPFEGKYSLSLNEFLLTIVNECLASGKRGINKSVFNHSKLGIAWDLYLSGLCGLLTWGFLFSSDNLLRIINRRFAGLNTQTGNAKRAGSPARSPETMAQRAEGERQRLVGLYLRWLAEPHYGQTMAANCLLLRIWLKPLSVDPSPVEQRLAGLLEPLHRMGLRNNDYKVQLKTSLQVFICLGNERLAVRNKRAHLIELYSDLARRKSDLIAKFVLVDFNQQSLYKILLHGHYNIKSSEAII